MQETKTKVTVELAQNILQAQLQDLNRRLDQGQVARLATLMRAHKWNEDIGTILLAKNGRLIDGQHRLSAVVEYGHPVTMQFRYDVDEDAIKYVDTGRARTTGQTLAILGMRLPTIQLATANLLAYFERMTPSSGLSISPRALTLDPDSVLQIKEHYASELVAMSSILAEHNAACIYAPLVYAAHQFPDTARVAMEFIKDGQVTDTALVPFHAGQKRLLRKGLGSGSERAETILFVFNLLKALNEDRAVRTVKLSDGPVAHCALVNYFSHARRQAN